MRLLFVTARPPWPGFRGDQARPAGWIQHLRARHDIRVVCQRWPGFPTPSPPAGVELKTVDVDSAALMLSALIGTARSTFGTGRPLQVNLFHQRAFRVAVQRSVEQFRPDAAVLMLSRLADTLPALDGVPVLLDFVDALALNMEHRARHENWPMSAFLRRESGLLKDWDRRALGRVQAASVVAERDRTSILEGISAQDERRSAAEKLEVLPFGLDLPEQLPWSAPTAPPRIVLTGNLGYFPTVDGARWFADRIWPKVRKRCPETIWQLAGARPGPEIRRLERRPGIRITPDPPDLAAVRSGATVAIAPLRSGSGTPIKILEAMADGIPVVTTPAGADGLDELPESAIAVAADEEEFSELTIRLLRDSQEAARLTQLAWDWLRERHDLKLSALRLEERLNQIAFGMGSRS